MGGPGSTRWAEHKKAGLVEDATALDTLWLMREGALGPNRKHVCRVKWGDDEGAQLHIRTGQTDGEVVIGYLVPTGHGLVRALTKAEVTTTHNGTRWTWICPRGGLEAACGRRAHRLYLPRGAHEFGCRACHNLTYRVSQQRGRLRFEERVWRDLGRKLARFAGQVRDDRGLKVLLDGIQAWQEGKALVEDGLQLV